MKPIADVSKLALPIAAGLASLPFLIESPLWGTVALCGAVGWTYGIWRQQIEQRTPIPLLLGETFSPLDVAIIWRTSSGSFPATRRGWLALVSESDIWLQPIRHSSLLGGDRDYVRIPLLDIVGCVLTTETEARVRFVDDEGRVQEVQLSHVPRAKELAARLGFEETGHSGSKFSDLGLLE